MFRILRKPPAKMLSLHRIVYNNNHQAKDLLERKLPPRWAPERDKPGLSTQDYQQKRDLAVSTQVPWTSDGKSGFQHKADAGNETDWLRYRHLPPTGQRFAIPEPQEIKDFMGYNKEDDKNWVGDLILEFKADIKEAKGNLILELSKGVDRFQARWDLSTGTCTLVRLSKEQGKKEPEELDRKETSLKKPGSYRLRFANVDERLTVWVDGSLPFGDGVPYSPPKEGGKSTGNDLEPASIGVQGAAVNVEDLSLWRDTYYTNSPKRPDTFTLYVQPGHYLCMGDNSPQSSDSRSWDAFPDYANALANLANSFPGQVALVHGDGHYFKVDKPLNGPNGGVIANFTRVETFGARNTHWVSAQIAPTDPNLFKFEARIVRENIQ